MDSSRRKVLTAMATLGVAGLAGCADGDDARDEPGGEAEAAEGANGSQGDDGSGEASPQGSATVHVRTHEEFGDMLVGSDGLTLYVFTADTQGAEESACPEIDGCDDNWPPVTVESEDELESGDSIEAELGTFERQRGEYEGELQVTANGWPLYYFAEDEEPGDVNGFGVNEAWWPMAPNGDPIMGQGGGTETEARNGD